MYLMGIDVGGMSIKGGISTMSGELLFKTSIPTAPKYDDKHSIVEDLRIIIDKLLELSDKSIVDFLGIGIGHPGSIDSEKGIIRYSNNVEMTNVSVVKELQEFYNVPIHISNDANCAALGEYVYGAGRGYNDIVFITIGTGIGSGIIINGRLFEGNQCAGAEAGHMVIETDGLACNCGRRGCWEAYASASALIRQTRAEMKRSPESLMHKYVAEDGNVNGVTAFKAAKNGDSAGQRVVNNYINYIAIGLTNLANIFRPNAILIGGGISNEKEYLTKPLQQFVDDFNFGAKFNPSVEIKVASLGNDAGILGAAALIINK